MATNRPGTNEGDGETTRAQAPAEGTDANAGVGGAGGAGGAGEGGGAGGAGGTGARRGGRRGATAEAGAAEGQTGSKTRSRSRKTAASGGADTQAAEGGKPRSRSRKAATEAGDSQGAQAGGTRGGGARKAGGSATGRGKKSAQESGPDLRGDLRQFVSSRPHGWGHDDWTGLLGNLRQRGHDVSDSEQIGRQLEQERLSHQLEQVEGLKPQQVRALSEHFRTLWSLRKAGVDEIAQVKNINRETAQRVHEQLR